MGSTRSDAPTPFERGSVTRWVTRRRSLPARLLMVTVGSGVLLHAILLGCLVLHARGWLSHDVMLALPVVNGLVPYALGRIGVIGATGASR